MKNNDRITDEALLAQLDHGDPVALAALYEHHGRFLYSLAFRITKDPRDAEEVLQDTFLKLWRKSSHFNSARGSLLGWLIKITRNGAIDRIRQRDYGFNSASKELCEETLPILGTSFLTQHIARELASLVLEELPSNQREAVTLAYFEGRTCEEIAARTATPLGTIKTRLRSALKTMKSKLSDPAFPISCNRQQLPVMLETILITEQLFSRPCRPHSSRLESEVFGTLARVVDSCPEQLIEFFLKMPIALCHAGTAGLSLLAQKPDGTQVFQWTNLAGKLAKHVGGSTPRNFSPCGVTLDYDAPQLFSYPGRYFHYFNDVDVPIVEGLVIPFRVGDSTEGTVWIISHEDGVGFDLEDVRIMTGLAEVVGCALNLMKSMSVVPQAQKENRTPLALAQAARAS